ncbi:MAG: tetratricopeptide repeat protein [Bdellovibrio sp.]
MKRNRWLLICFGLGILTACAGSPPRTNSPVDLDAEGRGQGRSGGPADSAPHSSVESLPERDLEKPAVEKKPLSKTELDLLSQAVRAGDWKQLEKRAQVILMKNPREPKALNSLGLASFRLSRPKVALYFFSKAMKSASPEEKGMLLNNMGLVHLQMGDEALALKDFREALQSFSGDVVSAANLGSLYLRMGDPGKALIAFDLAGARFSQDSKFLNNYGAALARERRYPEAEKKYRSALAISPASRETQLNLSILYIQHLKKPAEGREALSKFKFLGVPPELREMTNELENKLKSLK